MSTHAHTAAASALYPGDLPELFGGRDGEIGPLTGERRVSDALAEDGPAPEVI